MQKIYLSNQSEYFKRVFNESYGIILIVLCPKKFNKEILSDILRYIYGGNISVSVDKLNEYVNVFKFLEM